MRLSPRVVLSFALALSLPTLLLPATARAQDAASLQQRMSSADFKAAGLDKLSVQELQNLDAWLAHQGQPAPRVVDRSGAPVFYPDSGKRAAVQAHIVGHFAGWNGHNQVTLDNGQMWKQIGDDHPQCNAAEQPSVTVKPSLFGNWLMYVEGCNDMVHVRRVH